MISKSVVRYKIIDYSTFFDITFKISSAINFLEELKRFKSFGSPKSFYNSNIFKFFRTLKNQKKKNYLIIIVFMLLVTFMNPSNTSYKPQ
jgi:hypothetical protein